MNGADWAGFAATVIGHHGEDTESTAAACALVRDEAGARILLTACGLESHVDGWLDTLGMRSDQPSGKTGVSPDREALGQMARQTFIDFANEQPMPSPACFMPWSALSEVNREADRRIGETVFAAGRASRDEEVAALRAENERLEALFQQTHGCHSSWVAEGVRLRADVERLTAEREEARDWVRRMQAENVTTCIHCGTAFPPGTPTHGADALREHARVCEKHPMRAVEADLAAAHAALDVAEIPREAQGFQLSLTDRVEVLWRDRAEYRCRAATLKLIADLRDRDRGAGVGHTKQCRTKHGRITCDCGWADLAARLEAAS